MVAIVSIHDRKQPMTQPRQPLLHDLLTMVAAPTQVLSTPSGRIGGDGAAIGAQGILHADLRIVSALDLTVDGDSLEHIATLSAEPGPEWADRVVFSYVLRNVGTGRADSVDYQLRLDTERAVSPGRFSESYQITSHLPVPVTVPLRLALAHDLAPIGVIRVGERPPALVFPAPDLQSDPSWGSEQVQVTLHAPGARVDRAAEGRQLELTWVVEVPAHSTARVGWTATVADQGTVVVPPPSPPLDAADLVQRFAEPITDHRVRPWLERSLADLNGLRMVARSAPSDTFFAAGSPWYLTLCGRDSLWTARFLLPLDGSYAMGTLRTLARLAGTTVDPETAEQPGKIPHELRRDDFVAGELSLPPLYYGTIDATPLWVGLLHDAWRAGAPTAEVAELLPTLEAALRWMVDYGDADGDGFLEYLDASGHGLANQGWKDSADAVRFADGRIADGPVALCEVQGYAYQAAIHGAALLDAFDRPGGEQYRHWAAELSRRFRAQFWCEKGSDRFPALALDREKRRVDSLTSNIGHLLGTGLLDPEEERAVARALTGPAMDSGYGLRTMSADDAGFSPLSYHCGSVWPHDTAIAILGLYRAGLGGYAVGLVDGLLRASVAFEQRLPELWSGEGRPVPYPTSCRPQAWSAAAAVVVAGLLADPPVGIMQPVTMDPGAPGTR
jgi:glycogen debranching enzyme